MANDICWICPSSLNKLRPLLSAIGRVPGFPRPGGSVFGPPPSRRRPGFSPTPKWIAQAFPLAPARNELSFSRDSGVQSWHNPLSAPSLLPRAIDDATIQVASSERPRIPHVGTAACPCTRGGRAEVARSRGAQVRAFPRAASERALAALLLR